MSIVQTLLNMADEYVRNANRSLGIIFRRGADAPDPHFDRMMEMDAEFKALLPEARAWIKKNHGLSFDPFKVGDRIVYAYTDKIEDEVPEKVTRGVYVCSDMRSYKRTHIILIDSGGFMWPDRAPMLESEYEAYRAKRAEERRVWEIRHAEFLERIKTEPYPKSSHPAKLNAQQLEELRIGLGAAARGEVTEVKIEGGPTYIFDRPQQASNLARALKLKVA